MIATDPAAAWASGLEGLLRLPLGMRLSLSTSRHGQRLEQRLSSHRVLSQ